MFSQHLARFRNGATQLGGNLGRDSRGTVAVAFGASAIVLFAIVGGSVDFAQAYIAKTKLQSAIDAASLAATSQYLQDPTHNATAATATADAYFSNIMQGWGATATATIDQASFTVRMEGQVQVRTPFLALLGISNVAINARSEASGTDALGSGRNDNEVEMSLMLDVTGSMGQPSGSGGSKLEAMKYSAKRMIDILIPESGTPHAKVALAPFARSVNVGDFAGDVTGLPLTNSSGGSTKYLRRCVTERSGAQTLTDASPASGTWIPVHQDSGSNYVGSLTAAEACSQSHKIVPLTTTKSVLKAHIDGLTANGYTAGALGTAWAWYLLSPEWSGIFTGGSAPRPYGTSKLRKIAVLLTDGTYNTRNGTPYGDGSAEALAISQQAVDLCTGMKNRGIEVFTIGFRLDNTMARNTMRSCASSEDQAFLAENAEQLEAAFNDIAYRVVPLHLKK